MADPRFFSVHGPFTLAELAKLSGAGLGSAADGSAVVRDVAPLESAGAADIGFLDNRLYADVFAVSKAGACIVEPRMAAKAPRGMALLLSKSPYRDYARVAAAFYPDSDAADVFDASAPVHPSARIGKDTVLGPGVLVGAKAEIGRGCRIGAYTVIGAGVVIGDDCVISSHVSLSHALIGNKVTIEAGARIGQEGFGFAPDGEGYLKVPQLGRTIIGDDVLIGANTTVDRGSGPDTVIGPGCMIDNLVHIGHNVELGRGCIMAGQVGFAGSTKLGEYVMAGGQVGFAGHLRIGRGARIAAKSGVMRDIPDGATYAGFPALPVRDWHRQTVALTRLVKGKRRDG
jgi:UDP-3-O-[3-hydroxymyristoyl] glucosamine N-acyltransferase